MIGAKTGALGAPSNELTEIIQAGVSLKAEINRCFSNGLYFIFMMTLSVTLLLVSWYTPDPLGTPSAHSSGSPLFEAIGSVRKERESWDTNVLLTIPVTVLIPAIITLLFATAGRGTFGQEGRTIREQAHFEVLQKIMSAGLVLATVLALLALIPRADGAHLPDIVLALGAALACALLVPMLRPGPTSRRADIVASMMWINLLQETKKECTAKIAAGPLWYGRFQNTNLRSRLLLYTVVGAICSFFASIVIAVSPFTWANLSISWGRWPIAVVILAVPSGAIGLGVAITTSKWRLRQERQRFHTISEFFVIAVWAALMFLTMAAGGIATNEFRPAGSLIVAIFIAGAVGWGIRRFGILGACIDYQQAIKLQQSVAAAQKLMEMDEPPAAVDPTVPCPRGRDVRFRRPPAPGVGTRIRHRPRGSGIAPR